MTSFDVPEMLKERIERKKKTKPGVKEMEYDGKSSLETVSK